MDSQTHSAPRGAAVVSPRDLAASRADRLAARPSPGIARRVVSRIGSNRLAIVSLAVLVVIVVLAIMAPWIDRFPPGKSDLGAFETGPSSQHWLGTDSAGRDIWSRLLWGARTSLTVAVLSVAISLTIGTIVGALAGYYGRFIDSVLMRFTDGVMAFPDIVLVLMLASILGPSIRNVILVIGLLGWTTVARLVRGQFLALREREWVLAARSIGVSNSRLIVRHLIPHVVTQIVVAATFGAAGAILAEAGLSYLGFGIKPPASSWGTMLAEAQSVHVLQSMPWAWIVPGAVLSLVVLSISYVGETIRHAVSAR